MKTRQRSLETWVTARDKSSLLHQKHDVLFGGQRKKDETVISVDSTRMYQKMEGFGFSLTGGSAMLINQLPLEQKKVLLHELFSPEENGISFLRLSIGASDLSAIPFTYNDLPEMCEDYELTSFDIHSGDTDVIPLLKQILAINPNIKILGSPWSAPAWMKTNGSLIGGYLKPEYYSVYARYFVKYLEAMNEEGIAIHAITIQNEPENDENEPSMLMKASEQAVFIKNHLGPAFRSACLKTKIFCFDHNCDHPEYSLEILDDRESNEYLAGSAWHLYRGDAETLSLVHKHFPQKSIYFTEQWTGKNGSFDGDLQWHAKNVLIGTTRNWAEVVLEWNLASDSHCSPHTKGGSDSCVGALTIDGEIVTRNVSYYLIAHASKFIPSGSVRIDSNSDDTLPNVAFITPDGKIVLIVLNGSDSAQNFTIEYKGEWAEVSLNAGSLSTYIWKK